MPTLKLLALHDEEKCDTKYFNSNTYKKYSTRRFNICIHIGSNEIEISLFVTYNFIKNGTNVNGRAAIIPAL